MDENTKSKPLVASSSSCLLGESVNSKVCKILRSNLLYCKDGN